MEKLIIEQSRVDGKEDSFWYDGLVATMGKFRLYAVGDICVEFPDGNLESDGRAREYANDLGFADKDLEKLEWINNNWFEVGWETEDGRIEFDMGVVAHDFDEAMEMLVHYNNGSIK